MSLTFDGFYWSNFTFVVHNQYGELLRAPPALKGNSTGGDMNMY